MKSRKRMYKKNKTFVNFLNFYCTLFYYTPFLCAFLKYYSKKCNKSMYYYNDLRMGKATKKFQVLVLFCIFVTFSYSHILVANLFCILFDISLLLCFLLIFYKSVTLCTILSFLIRIKRKDNNIVVQKVTICD